MTPLSWFGSLAPWLLIAGTWIVFGLVFALAFGLLVGAEGRKEGRK